jgi:hypothetical protein
MVGIRQFAFQLEWALPPQGEPFRAHREVRTLDRLQAGVLFPHTSGDTLKRNAISILKIRAAW